jgi:hypothetical protein
VPTIPEKPAMPMVNADVMETSFGLIALLVAAGGRLPSGLLAGRCPCCSCLDFKQFVYLFGLQ